MPLPNYSQLNTNQFNEYYHCSLNERELQHELEKGQLEISFLKKELMDKQRIIELLETK